jgi:alkanesulfonate monooxygenase SsuD/methylene tetrahydromethanopterin reductase-like flavin-dependent oxidoreductase (luciferase family)
METSRILLGTSITSVFVRSAPTIAMAALTIDELSGGRFNLGARPSHKVQVEGEHRVPNAKPLTRVRETVALIRRLAQDGRVSFHGETVRLDNFDLWFTPRRRAFPIYVSAVFPKMAALCGEIADGIVLIRSTTATAGEIRTHLAEGASRAGRRPDEVSITSLLPTAIGESHQHATVPRRAASYSAPHRRRAARRTRRTAGSPFHDIRRRGLPDPLLVVSDGRRV